MDTPQKNQINAVNTNSIFEHSPVFNFINSLSPIKYVKKAAPITQTFNSLVFSSPPSVFTSPHVSSLKESRFMNRHIDVKKIYSNEEALADSTPLHGNLSEIQESTYQRIFVSNAAIELPQPLKYNCGRADKANNLLELHGEATSDVQEEGYETDSVERKVLHEGIEPKSERSECDWDGLIPESTDLLIFNSPNEAGAFHALFLKPLDSSVNFTSLLPQTTINNDPNVQIVDSGASGSDHENEDRHSEPVAVTETGQALDNVAMNSIPNEKTDDELVYVTQRGLRRRCLDFEMASVLGKNSDDNSNTDSTTSQSVRESIANEKQLVPTKRNSDSRKCILPGIGLHLNALATLKDRNSTKIDELSSGRQLSLLCSTSSLQISTSQEHHHLALVAVSSERELDLSNNGVHPAEDCSQAHEYLNQNSPKRKRRKSDPAGETEGCKRCNCKKSKCLKLYCECFAAGVYCIEPCSCQDCFNQAIHEDTVLQTRKQIESRNPLAFAPKVIRSSESVTEVGDDPNKTPASARHKRGCNCKKSSCLKKYCECYQGGVGCSIGCRCEGCKNAFGRKDGSALIEVDPEEETEACEKGVAEKALQKTVIQNIEDHSDPALVSTPSRLSRPLLPLPFSSKGKPPRSFVATISGSALFASSSQKLGKPNSVWSQSKHFQTVTDDEIPDVLRNDSSPIACIKTSPNGKRISSPNCDLGSSPSRRGGRKLILQSIPSFPSLTNHQ
ncbi:PREDICTED: protein tesmin/TSO1-like CXC 2 [Lupinus angustifolius]|uniref:protein tesmin/TSO1-like CXC 2 n=1 Tax=Lupinus angustifolius TaxID=3871 RepID=UPI00092F2D58|nr:PREDICTED: protein tesmin/TSO1-like CXC 2 [Lupinus angustifolius]